MGSTRPRTPPSTFVRRPTATDTEDQRNDILSIPGTNSGSEWTQAGQSLFGSAYWQQLHLWVPTSNPFHPVPSRRRSSHRFTTDASIKSKPGADFCRCQEKDSRQKAASVPSIHLHTDITSAPPTLTWTNHLSAAQLEHRADNNIFNLGHVILDLLNHPVSR